MRVNYVIIFVSDMVRSISFYRDVIGFPLKFETPEWTEFATEGATWALHKSEKKNPEDADVKPESAGQCRSGFQVGDLEAFHRRMLEYGVPCMQAPTRVFGALVAQYADPDGMVFSVGEDG